MKKVFVCLCVILALVLGVSCGTEAVTLDYKDATTFEADLNAGKDLTGKTVRITVDKFVPDSAFGFNIQTGAHLNFCSPKHPGVTEGDTLTVRVDEISSVLGSYIISYTIVDAIQDKDTPAGGHTNIEPDATTQSVESEQITTPVVDSEDHPEKTEFKIGETWTVEGQWELTVTDISETSDRNEFSDKSPAAVYIVSFTYKNLGYTDANGIMDGLYLVLDDSVVDSEDFMGYSYPGDITDYPQETPVGASCKGQVCIGVDNAGLPIKLNVSQYDGDEIYRTAAFVLE
jgi:prophage lp2 protein 7